jgi:hypothetical protein
MSPSEKLDICKQCEHLKAPFNRCEKCGCFMDLKVYIETVRCPIGKW